MGEETRKSLIKTTNCLRHNLYLFYISLQIDFLPFKSQNFALLERSLSWKYLFVADKRENFNWLCCWKGKLPIVVHFPFTKKVLKWTSNKLVMWSLLIVHRKLLKQSISRENIENPTPKIRFLISKSYIFLAFHSRQEKLNFMLN